MSETPLNLTITPFGAVSAITFTTFDEAMTWLNFQKSEWGQFHRLGNSYRVVLDHETALSSTFDAVLQARANKSPESAVEALRKLERPPFLDASGNAAVLIKDALEIDDHHAATIIYSLWANKGYKVQIGRSDVNFALLLRAAALWRKGDDAFNIEVVGYQKVISDRLGNWETKFYSLFQGAGRNIDKNMDASDNLHEQQKALIHDLQNTHETFNNKLDNLCQTQSDALTKIRETYLEHLRLKAPADYWTEKARKHAASAKLWLKWLMGFIAIGLIGLVCFLYGNFYSLIDHVSTKSANTTAVVLLALPALLYLTLVRVAHKSYRDEVRHAVDAEQRSTLVQTYLALTKDDDGQIQPGERLLALHALFRGSAQSDSPDDTPPVNSLEAIIQSLKPKT